MMVRSWQDVLDGEKMLREVDEQDLPFITYATMCKRQALGHLSSGRMDLWARSLILCPTEREHDDDEEMQLYYDVHNGRFGDCMAPHGCESEHEEIVWNLYYTTCFCSTL